MLDVAPRVSCLRSIYIYVWLKNKVKREQRISAYIPGPVGVLERVDRLSDFHSAGETQAIMSV